jgi:hypothetical protein
MARLVGIDPNVIWRLEMELFEGMEGCLGKVWRFMEAEAERRIDEGG